MMTPEQYALLLKLATQQRFAVDTLFGIVNDFARMIEPTLKRCVLCPQAATVLHAKQGTIACDRCAAERVINDRVNDNVWIDLPDAERVRRLLGYVAVLQESEASIVSHH